MKDKEKLFLLVCSISFIFLSGCETTKGLVTGVVKDTANICETTVYVVQKTDEWIKENLW